MLRIRTAASLLTALATGSSFGCGASSDEVTDPDPSGGGGGPRYATATEADAEFLEAYASTHRFELGRPRGFAVLPDGSGVLFLRSASRSFAGELFLYDVEAAEARVLLTAEDLLGGEEESLTAEERARRERMRSSARGIASFTVSRDGARILVPLSGRVFVVERALIGGPDAVRELASESGPAIDARFSPDGTKVACVREGDLYVTEVETGEERRLTTRPSQDVEHGLAEFVAQEEMDRMRGYFWSPDSTQIAYQRTDHAGMERMHILDPMHPERAPQAWPYPRPGEANARVELGVISIEGGETTWVRWDQQAYPYLASVRWSAGAPLTVLVQNRAQQEMALLAVELETGRTETLLRETDDAWLNLDQSVPRWVRNGASFLWSSERSGHPVLELRARDGSLERTLTEGEFGYRAVLAVDDARGEVWVKASADPTETQIHAVPIAEGEEARALTEGAGEHDAVVGEGAELWVELAHRRQDGRVERLRRGDGTEVAIIPSVAEAPPFEPNLDFQTIGRRDWRAVIVRPRDFDESLRYPVILHVYGGPGVRYVTATRDRYLLSQWYADHGFIVVTIDGRGTPARGREWERAIRGDFITVPLEDQVEALQQLADRHPEMDLERVGVWGWSFGGYFSAMAALRRPDVFRAAVAGAPVSEWRDYDTHYTERYLGMPEADDAEDGPYRQSSVLTYAAEPARPGLDRPLFVIHGTADDNVYFSHALKLQNALFRAGRSGDLLALSGLTHMVPEAAVMREMHARVAAFFEAHLRRPAVSMPE